MKQIFSEQGVPKIVRSDNGPHYSSASFHEFAKEYGFEHITSSPHYPQSNGFIENQVKTVKAVLHKTARTNEDPYMALLCLRSTPIDSKLPSPSELLLGRKLQDNLPRSITRNQNNEEIIERLKKRQELQKHYYDRNTKTIPDLLPGQNINIQNPSTKKWGPATVKEKLDQPRSYTVTTPKGGELRRNRTHIREALPSPIGHQSPPAESPGTEVSNPAPHNGMITTRSGRVVKPPERYI
ncbi:uncharacterized protein K02A2.6-like [Actinia tenebrosa]|uniref:Uncharacterized protein K02A2.6-like n=1 Tax=Actinia tenebrosa TaxID=6105 RepID=A0A6P8H0X3_ACTTE|nr:uncharacterized protein K02A2.6-like [Actinia tenebrosa]